VFVGVTEGENDVEFDDDIGSSVVLYTISSGDGIGSSSGVGLEVIVERTYTM
jgi:hypothetical protein